MLLQEPPETDYDLRFMLLGFPVRVSWTFWLGAMVFGYNLCLAFPNLYGSPVTTQGSALGIGPLLIVWTLCLFLSILIHELGHALAFRYYGLHSSLVLYHFGGLAIPTGGYTPGKSISRIGDREQLVISLAGPALQIIAAVVVILVVKLGGYEVEIFKEMPSYLKQLPWVTEGEQIPSQGLYALVSFFVYPSIVWALLNLVPVWPLDGGRIARSIVVMTGGTVAQSLWISIICAGAIALYCLQVKQPFMAVFFGMFAFMSFQMLNPMGGRGGYR
ncbi:MAG: site-2 protease family protein [Planctomycetota bacterium]